MNDKPILSDGVSYPNKVIYYLLFQIKNELDFLDREFYPDWCKFELNGKSRKGYYDIYFGYKNKEYIVEMDGGIGHGNKSIDGTSKEDAIFIDNEKDRLAKEHNITVIRVDVYYKTMYGRNDYIKNEIIKSLKDILPIEKLDFNQAFIDSENSLVEKCASLWNEGFTAGYIRNKYDMNESMVSDYLRRATRLGLCQYDSIESIRRSSATSVICLNTKQVYTSILEASNICNIDRKSIQMCCDGECYSAGKDATTNERLFWMYYEKYLNMSDEEIRLYLYDKKYDQQKSNRTFVVCLNTLILYTSTVEAAKHCNTYDPNISKCCKGELKRTGHLDGSKEKLSWAYYDDYIKENDPSTLTFFNESAIFIGI